MRVPRRPSEHFSWDECRCKCGCLMTEEIAANIIELCVQMEIIRTELGLPIDPQSTHRCVTHNEKVGGEENSLHIKGMAMDFKVAGLDAKMIKARLEALISAGKLKQGGIGLYKKYPDLIHYDYRGKKARWTH